MPDERTYSPAELCDLLKLPKSTLLRWERENLVPHVDRDTSDQRRYTLADFRRIAAKQMEQLERRYAQVSKGKGLMTYQQLEDLYLEYRLRRFLSGDIQGLRELAQSRDLPLKTIQLLLRAATEIYMPGDKVFGEILDVVREYHERASAANASKPASDAEPVVAVGSRVEVAR